MTGTELARRREAAGRSADSFAELLGEHTEQLLTWERMPQELPGHLSRKLNWFLTLSEREAALHLAGAEPCPLIAQLDEQAAGTDLKTMRKLLQEAEAHAAECPVCRKWRAIEATLPPLPELPLPASGRALLWIHTRVSRLPPWLRPAAYGALLAGAITLVRALLSLAFGQAELGLPLLVTVLLAVGLGGYGGAAGGLAYAWVEPRVRQYGKAAPYLAGLACVYAFLLAVLIPLIILEPDRDYTSLPGLIAFLVVGTVFGLLIGHSWFRDR